MARNKRSDSKGPSLTTARSGSPLRWRSILALIIIGIGLALEVYWIWGVLFVIWAINDLINRRTYLLEDIPRHESPVLYWIVVLMWLLMGIWTLVLSPVAYIEEYSLYSKNRGAPPQVWKIDESLIRGSIRPVVPKPGAKAVSGIKQVSHEKLISRNLVVFPAKAGNVGCRRFGFSLRLPEGWECRKTEDAESVSFEMSNRLKTGYVLAMAVDCHSAIPLEQFILHMEAELAPHLPFISPADQRRPASPAFKLNPPGIASKHCEYTGPYKGCSVKAITSYAMKGRHGFAIMGIYETSDRAMRKAVTSVMGSFKLAS